MTGVGSPRNVVGTPGGPVGSQREPVNRRTPPRSVSSVVAPPTRSTATPRSRPR